MYGIKLDRYAVPSGLRDICRSCRIENRRDKSLRWDMPSFQDFFAETETQVLKGRYTTTWGFIPMKKRNMYE